MEKLLIKNNLVLALGCLVLFASCGGNAAKEGHHQNVTKQTENESNTTQNAGSKIDDKTKEHVNQVLQEYYTLKSALVDTDAQKAKSAGEKLVGLFDNFDVSSVQEDFKSIYENLSDQIHHHATKVAQAGDIEVQRNSFSEITAGVYEMVKTFNANEEDVYYSYCPMAFDNSGGYWLSDEKEIKNPYFGSKMLKCGSVKETIAEN